MWVWMRLRDFCARKVYTRSIMKHYICIGECKGESATPTTCQNEHCHKEGEPLTPCDCTDGVHKQKEPDEEESELT